MRLIVFVKANADSEAGKAPSTELLTDMMKYNEALIDAGILKGGDGLKPSSSGARVQFFGKERTVLDGPFTETKELVSGYWLWEVESMEQAIEWAKKCPNPTGEESTLELRPLFDPEDFGDEFTYELQEKEEKLRQQEASG